MKKCERTLMLGAVVLLTGIVGCASTSGRGPARRQSLAPHQDDHGGIAEHAEQRVCPVTGAELSDVEAPVKVVIGGQPLYLCCKDCLAEVQRAPEAYLRKASQSSQVR